MDSTNTAMGASTSNPSNSSSALFSRLKILLIGTHADLDKNSSPSNNSSSSSNSTKQKQSEEGPTFQSQYSGEKAGRVKQMLENYYVNDDMFDLSEKHFVLDARAAWVPDIKQLIQCLVKRKQAICERLPRCTMFLNRTLFHIQNWRKSFANVVSVNASNPAASNTAAANVNGNSFGTAHKYPIVTWKHFVEQIREVINPLASDNHLCKLKQQLQLMGKKTSLLDQSNACLSGSFSRCLTSLK